jgi:hypothetical protein
MEGTTWARTRKQVSTGVWDGMGRLDSCLGMGNERKEAGDAQQAEAL